MTSVKFSIPNLLKINAFWNKGCDFIIKVDDVINSISLHDTIDIVNVILCSKFDNFKLFLKEIIKNLIL